MTTRKATTARQVFFDLIKGETEGHQTFCSKHRRGSAAPMSEAHYDGLLESLEMLSLPGFLKRLKASVKQMKSGDTVSMEELLGPGK